MTPEQIKKKVENFLLKKIVAVVAATYDDFQCWQAMYGRNDEHYILISRPFYDGIIFDRIEFDETCIDVPEFFYKNLKTTKQ